MTSSPAFSPPATTTALERTCFFSSSTYVSSRRHDFKTKKASERTPGQQLKFAHGYTDNVPSSIHCRLLHLPDHLLGLPDVDTHIALLVANHHNRLKMQLLPSFHHLCHPP
ncbi:hypothetical protein ACFX13_015064 [Malus domestica]